MTVTTTLVVQDRVDAYELFSAARTVLGLPLDGRWHLVDYGAIHMLQTLPGQGAPALASVHFPVQAGAYHPGDPDADVPGGYALLAFTSDGGDTNTIRRWHRDLAGRAGAWLTDRRLRWTWAYDDGPWTVGYAGPHSPQAVSR